MRVGACLALSVATSLAVPFATQAHASYILKWAKDWKLASNISTTYSCESIGDLNGDNAAEVILVGPGDSRSYFRIVNGLTGNIDYDSPMLPGGIVQIFLADTDADGLRDVVLTYLGGTGTMVVGWSGPFAGLGSDSLSPESDAESIDLAPNPLASGTTVHLHLNAPNAIELQVLDVTGRLVRTLAAGPFPAGDHAVPWNGLDEQGYPVAAGTYFSCLRVGGKVVDHNKAVVLH